MELDELRIFTKVAELSSFTRAAEQLGLAKGRVSTAVRRLEGRLGARLLQRTTRSVRLTPDGERFLDRSKALLADAEQLQALFQPASSGLTGRLRIDLPTVIAREVVLPRLPDFLAANPRLEIAIGTTDRRVDLIQEGFDCVLRIGTLVDSELVARTIGWMSMCNLASPAYLRKQGTPESLADLERHRIVHYAPALTPHDAGWEYVDDAGTRQLLPMRNVVTVNGTEAYQAACIAGLGLIQAPGQGARQAIAAGLLVDVLPEFRAPPMPVSLLYSGRYHLAPRVQAFMAWLMEVVVPTLDPVREASPPTGRGHREHGS